MNIRVRNPDEAPFGESHGPGVVGAFAPVFAEEVLEDLRVEGEIPADLNGVYLRNGPNPRFEPNGSYHPFDGDGMIHGAHFDRGRVTYRNRWVRTAAWQEEDRTGRSPFWGIMSTLKGRDDLRLKDSANTDVIAYGGKALASWYLAGTPYRIDPVTLQTLGPAEFVRGTPGGGFSAHPKVDEHTGELLYFDYGHEHPYMWYGVVDAGGKLSHHVPIELPGSRLPHDMAITEHYSILHDLPVFHDEAAWRAGRHKIRFDASLPTRFGVIPRYGAPETLRWFEFSPCFLYHVVNAWEEGEEIVMVACRYMPARDARGNIDEALTAHRIATLVMDARLWRYRMNLRTGATREECLDNGPNIEFPTYDAQRTGRHSRYAYLVDHDPAILRWTGLRKYDTDTGHCLGAFSDGHPDCWYSESWFAPADGQRAEDDGYVVSFVWNARTRSQQLQVFDAHDITQGPVARVHLPHRIPPGFHACWVRKAQIT
jgi:carotenoid cleavage dioxygenase